MIAVSYLTKNHVQLQPSKGFDITLFAIPGGEYEAVVVSRDGSETLRLKIAGPTDEQRMLIQKEHGVIDIIYEAK